MKVNWKVRFKNKAWLTSFFAAILTFVYTMLGMFDVYPEVTKNEVGEIISSILMFLSLIGVIVDPTTAGVSDSLRALGYDTPWVDDGTEIHPEPAISEPTLVSEEPVLVTDIDKEMITETNVDQGES